MNRKQFSETVAQAYMNQYHWQEYRRRQVMNNPVIDYDMDNERFVTCSSLTPTQAGEVRVLELSDGMFGNDERPTKAAIVYYLTHDASDDLWNEVVVGIEQARAERQNDEE